MYIDKRTQLWINSDEKSKKFLLENIEIFRNVRGDLHVENDLEQEITKNGQCLVIIMKKREATTLFLKSLKCERQASAICVLDTIQRKARYKRTKFPCISHESKLRQRREADGIYHDTSTTSLQNEDWEGNNT